MSRSNLSLAFVVGIALLGNHAIATPFEPLARLGKIQGKCQVMAPGQNAYVAAEEGRAYPYGTQIMTPEDGSLVIIFGLNNECAVGAGVRLKLGERRDDKTRKVIYLEQGRIDIALAEAYETINGLDVVTHCAVTTCLKGGKSFVEAKTDQDLHTQLIGSEDTDLRIKGPQFDIPLLHKEQWVSISCATDRRFIRIKDIKGDITATTQGPEGKPQEIAMQPGTTIKILQKNSDVPGEVVVAVLVVLPDGTPDDKQSVTYTTQGEGPGETPGTPAPGAPTTTVPLGQWEPMWSSTTTTSTTSTTRPTAEIPPPAPTPTPVGNR